MSRYRRLMSFQDLFLPAQSRATLLCPLEEAGGRAPCSNNKPSGAPAPGLPPSLFPSAKTRTMPQVAAAMARVPEGGQHKESQPTHKGCVVNLGSTFPCLELPQPTPPLLTNITGRISPRLLLKHQLHCYSNHT